MPNTPCHLISPPAPMMSSAKFWWSIRSRESRSLTPGITRGSHIISRSIFNRLRRRFLTPNRCEQPWQEEHLSLSGNQCHFCRSGFSSRQASKRPMASQFPLATTVPAQWIRSQPPPLHYVARLITAPSYDALPGFPLAREEAGFGLGCLDAKCVVCPI